MKNRRFYKFETINIPFWFGVILVLGFMLGLTNLRIKDPTGWTPDGYLTAMGFLSLGLMFEVGISYFSYGKYKKEFLNQRREILENGVCVSGKVIDTKTIDRFFGYDSNGKRDMYQDYIVLVEFENKGRKIQYWTPELAFNGEKLTSDVVSVYSYKDKYYVDDFEIDSKYIKKWSTHFGKGIGY